MDVNYVAYEMMHEMLGEELNYLEDLLPQVLNKEVSYEKAKQIIERFKEVYYEMFGKEIPGIDEELDKLYGRV